MNKMIKINEEIGQNSKPKISSVEMNAIMDFILFWSNDPFDCEFD